MKNKDFFDVLNISDNLNSVDMIQTMLGDECLGTFFQNGLAKLYFNSGLRKEIDIKLGNLLTENTFTWSWEKQTCENWHLAWQEHFKPVVIDNKLAVIPHWKNDKPAEITISIKPGMAFGTGHHETTWLMLSQMLKYLKPGMSVLDLGTGSGILSIAAKKMGAVKVDSVEHDLDCEPNFYENLQLNKIIDGIQFHHGDVLSWIKLDYDLILANINQKIIGKLIINLKKINAIIIISGLLESDYKDIVEICSTNRLIIKEKILKGDWLCLIINSQS